MKDVINLENEVWKPIQDFEDKYEVSNLGRVKSLNYNNTGLPQLLKLSPNHNGYLQVALSRDNHRTMKLVHRLVAEAFIPNPNNLPQINHISEVKTENWVENLEWCDAHYNNNYGNHGQRSGQTRTGVYGRNSTCKPVLCVETGIIYTGAYEAGKKLGINNSNINLVCRGIRKTAGGYHWQFVEE